ncbi:MAG: ATP synthase F1 subunit gamma [Tissierellia bacterium]|nr:ATP synthase F1 subunit gamma [Tissierellia bacterium]
MANTQEIKRRIRGINNIKQITNAMELVSTAKFRRAKIQLEASRPYYERVVASIREALKGVKAPHPLLEQREVKTVLYIVLTSDRGLAGGYNANVQNLVQETIEKRQAAAKLIVVGSKGREYFSRREMEIVESYTEASENPNPKDAQVIGQLAMDLYESGEVDAIDIVFTQFYSILQHEPQLVRLLPSENFDKEEGQAQVLVDFEPSADEVLDYLIPKYIESSILGALIEASASEQGARRTAMEAATENAEDMIDELATNYNRVRQAAITAEITEIVGATDAIS